MAKRPGKPQRHPLFDLDEARADYVHASQLGFWTPDEATAYSMGYVPSLVNPISVKPFLSSSPIAVEFERRREVVNRSILVEELTERVNPTDFLAWARRRRLQVPKDLEIALAPASDIELGSSATTVERSLREEVASLTRKNEELQRTTEPHPRRLRSINSVIAGMAIGSNYQFRPTSARNGATGKIKSDIERIGLTLSEDTILGILREAAQLDGIVWPSDDGR
ncbi:MAG: hypothetical protein JNM89_06195 [Hyphomicrobiaceae bacterium]|nr:hypothetical protein [Hyphomicrobiaceae bacterium]